MTKVLVRASDGEAVTFEVLDGAVVGGLERAVRALATLGGPLVGRATLAPGCTVELEEGAPGTPWADRLRSCAQVAETVAAWHRLPRNAVRRRLLKLDGWAWDAHGLRVPAWLGAESVAPAAVEAACPGLWGRLDVE